MVAQALTIELSEEQLNSIDAAKDDTMSRPKPTIILEHTDNVTYKCEQVLEAEAIWAVFYKGKPFNLKSSNINCPDLNCLRSGIRAIRYFTLIL